MALYLRLTGLRVSLRLDTHPTSFTNGVTETPLKGHQLQTLRTRLGVEELEYISGKNLEMYRLTQL